MKLSERLRKGLAIKEKIGRSYCAAVIVAAGTSSRMGGTNKILTVLENLPVICRTVDVFDKCAMIDEIIVVTQQELLEKVSRYLKAYDKMRMVVAGGETRTDSVMAGLAAVSDRTQLVAVHDGARPLVTDAVICRAVSKAKSSVQQRPLCASRTPSKSRQMAQLRKRPTAANSTPSKPRRFSTVICLPQRFRMRKNRKLQSRMIAALSKRSACPCS